MENRRIRKSEYGVGAYNPHGCTRHPRRVFLTGESRSMSEGAQLATKRGRYNETPEGSPCGALR